MTTLFDPPRIFELPFSKGGDLYFVFKYKELVTDEDGEPVLLNGKKQYEIADYPDGSSVVLIIENGDSLVEVDATIDGSEATFWEDKAVADTVLPKKFWRAVITYSDGLDKVLCNGLTIRSDGKVPKSS